MGKLLATCNLEDGRPDRHEAALRLAHALHGARQQHSTFLKVIHGYGSSGAGGVLRFVAWNELRQAKERGEIRAFVAGEQFRISDERTWELLKKYPELKHDPDFGRGNKGITLVWL